MCFEIFFRAVSRVQNFQIFNMEVRLIVFFELFAWLFLATTFNIHSLLKSSKLFCRSLIAFERVLYYEACTLIPAFIFQTIFLINLT